MTNQNLYWAQNLKFLRNRLNISQDELSGKLKISRSKLAAHENGNTINPAVEDLYRFSEFYKISIDTLLKVDLSGIGELKLRELEAGNDVYLKGGNLRVLAITVDKTNKENVELVPIKAKAGYCAGFNDPEFIATLPKYSLPGLPKDKSNRIFAISGDSMLPIPENSHVIGQYVEDMQEIKPGTPCIVILKTIQDIVFKLVTLKGQRFILESLNTLYEPYEVDTEDVQELWKFHSFMSTSIPKAATDMDSLMHMMQEMKMDIKKIFK